MTNTLHKQTKRTTRHARIRSKVSGTAERPRLAVFRSNRFIYAQLINDDKGVTVTAVDSRGVEGKNATERATSVGKSLAEKAKKMKIKIVVFDRGGFKYTGMVAALADGARDGGLRF